MTLNNTMHATLYNSIQDYTTLYKAIRHHTTLYNVIQDYTTIYKAIQRAPYTFCVKRDGLILLSGET
jgi:predicted small integral membrane protein